MKTVAIISQKGGAGKTTMSVHLAVAAELRGELGLGRKLLAVHEEAQLDRLTHLLHYLVRPPRRSER